MSVRISFTEMLLLASSPLALVAGAAAALLCGTRVVVKLVGRRMSEQWSVCLVFSTTKWTNYTEFVSDYGTGDGYRRERSTVHL